MPDPQQQPSTPQASPQDFLTKYRQKFDDSRPDADVLQKLSDPNNFRKAFGDEYDLSGKSDDDIKKFMGGTKPQVPATSPVTAGGPGRALQMGPNGPLFVDAPKGQEASMEKANQEGAQTGGKIGMTALALPAAIASPVAAVGALAGGYGGGKLARYGAKTMFGAGEDVQDLSEVGGNLVGGALGGMAGEGLSGLRGKIGAKVFTPEGKTTPLGEAISHPIDKGTEFALRKVFPPPQPEGVGATEPSASEFYQNKAETLMERQKAQDALERQDMQNRTLRTVNDPYQQKGDALMRRAQQQDALENQDLRNQAIRTSRDPFQQRGEDILNRGREQNLMEQRDMTNRTLRTINDPMQQKAESLMNRGTQQATLDRVAARAVPKPAKGVMTIGDEGQQTLSSVARQTPFETPQPLNSVKQVGATSTTGPEVKMVNKIEPPPPKTIIEAGSPEAKIPSIEGSYWQWKEARLRDAVLGGDRQAAIIYKTRFGTLPSGSKYLTDAGQGVTRGLYQSNKPD